MGEDEGGVEIAFGAAQHRKPCGVQLADHQIAPVEDTAFARYGGEDFAPCGVGEIAAAAGGVGEERVEAAELSLALSQGSALGERGGRSGPFRRGGGTRIHRGLEVADCREIILYVIKVNLARRQFPALVPASSYA